MARKNLSRRPPRSTAIAARGAASRREVADEETVEEVGVIGDLLRLGHLASWWLGRRRSTFALMLFSK
jgi:hypothetical protein